MADRRAQRKKDRLEALLEVLELADAGASHIECGLSAYLPYIVYDLSATPDLATVQEYIVSTTGRTLRIEHASVRASILEPSSTTALLELKNTYINYAAKASQQISTALQERIANGGPTNRQVDSTDLQNARQMYGDARAKLERAIRRTIPDTPHARNTTR